MTVRYQKRINRTDVQSHPDVLFVFGDNMASRGYGGQARAMRGEPNAVGIPTKWTPDRTPGAYFTNVVLYDRHVLARIEQAFARLEAHAAEGGLIIVPADGVGTGRAQLPALAPTLYRAITARIKALGDL